MRRVKFPALTFFLNKGEAGGGMSAIPKKVTWWHSVCKETHFPHLYFSHSSIPEEKKTAFLAERVLGNPEGA